MTTNYTYDVLHRLTGKTYSDGTTASAIYAYDNCSLGHDLDQHKGRLTTEYTAYTSGTLTDNLYNYDPLGRESQRGQCHASELYLGPNGQTVRAGLFTTPTT